MSDLRFLDELGAEFKRVGAQGSRPQTRRRGGPRWGRAPRGAFEAVVVGLSLLMVVAVAAVVLSTHGRRPTGSAGNGHGTRVVFTASMPGRRAGLQPAVRRSMAVLRSRLDSVFHGVRVFSAGSNIVVVVHGAASGSRARIVALAAPAHLAFYDWEGNVLLPSGQTVASMLKHLPPGYLQDPSLLTPGQRTAVSISQGAGTPGDGSLSLYGAVKLASNQPTEVSPDNGREGSQYYMFGGPGSSACSIVGRRHGYTPSPGERCLLSGPDSSLQALYNGLPRGIGRSQGQVLTVPQGTAVVQATPSTFSTLPRIWSPSARFYVLKDHVALFGTDVTNPQQSTDPSGAPDVTFGFTSKGGAAFQKLTSEIAARGQEVSALGSTLDQHFAVALDQQLITVPQIDFRQYPNGIVGRNGADITGRFSTQSAQMFATLLRFGSLSVNLTAR